ncbi:MAG: DUF2202 domain-containing protein [Campylobacterota bacterium]
MNKKTSTIKRRNFMKILGIGAVATASSAFAAGGSGGGGQVSELTEEQKDTLFYIFQEEKVARDVYITLGKLYPNESTFANIQLSEQTHILSAQDLCIRYGMDTSMVNLSLEDEYVGLFELDSMQKLYDSCVELGSEGLLPALRVGEEIELTDIADLEHASEGMPRDVVNVYANLKDGSLSHLDAFRRSIESVLTY